jgi:hypothetical protein
MMLPQATRYLPGAQQIPERPGDDRLVGRPLLPIRVARLFQLTRQDPKNVISRRPPRGRILIS